MDVDTRTGADAAPEVDGHGRDGPGAAAVAALAAAWDRAALRHPAPSPLGPGPALALAVEASEPFRTGTRYGALPAVRMRTAAGGVVVPGPLLPRPDDRDVPAYLDRVTAALGHPDWELTVVQPLFLDVAAWTAVRGHLAALWRAVGSPCLPLVAELTFGAAGAGTAVPDPPARDPHPAELLWVLTGAVHAAAAGATVRATAGDVLHRPGADARLRPVPDGGCFLRILVPTAPAAAGIAVHHAVSRLVRDLAAARDGTGTPDDDVPFLPYPPPDGTWPDLQRAAADVRAVLAGDDVDRLLHADWVRRVSAAGLEPVPVPRPPVAVTTAHVVRRVAEVVLAPAPDGRSLWAVNGHAFPVGGRLGEAVLDRLPPGREVAVGDLCEAVGAAGHPDGVLALLAALYRVRGLELAGATAGDTTGGTTGAGR